MAIKKIKNRLIFHTKFKRYGWLKAALKILVVSYVQFLGYLSSKSSLSPFYGNCLCIRFQQSIPSVYLRSLYFILTTLTGCVDL